MSSQPISENIGDENNTQSLLDTELISLHPVTAEELLDKPELPVLEEEQEEEQRRVSLRKRNTTSKTNTAPIRSTRQRSSPPTTSQSTSRKRKSVENEKEESGSDDDFDPTDWMPTRENEKIRTWYTKWYKFMKQNSHSVCSS